MSRLKVLKTYKLYIGGKFPRTESGRFFKAENSKGESLANMCLASRKDFRNAVVAARKACDAWASKTAYNRSQILYRIAEMLETKRSQILEELIAQGSTAKQANQEMDVAVDRLIYYAGWCDKYTQVFGSVNPVATSHFNFSTQESVGIVTAICPEEGSVLGPVSVIAPVIASGNSLVMVASRKLPLCAITLAEVINNSDVPGGVVNILTGNYKELMPHIGKHMDVNSVWFIPEDKDSAKQLEIDAAENVKRIVNNGQGEALTNQEVWESPYLLQAFTEVKTTWHPIEKVGGAVSSY